MQEVVVVLLEILVEAPVAVAMETALLEILVLQIQEAEQVAAKETQEQILELVELVL